MSKRREYVKIVYDSGFNFGNCALRALARAVYLDTDNEYFNLTIKALVNMKEVEEGLSFYQIKKILNFLVKAGKITIAYYPNTYRLSYLSLVAANPDRDILSHFDGHLSCARKGEILDGYYSQEEIRKEKPTGWWFITKISNKPKTDIEYTERRTYSLGTAGLSYATYRSSNPPVTFNYSHWFDAHVEEFKNQKT